MEFEYYLEIGIWFLEFILSMKRRIYKKPHRARRKKPLWTKPIFWRTIFLSGSGAFAFWLVCFSPVFEVQTIKIDGAEKIEEGEVVEIIEKELNKKIGLLDSKSILLFNLDQTKKDLMARLPQVQDIVISREFPSKIIASVQERRAAAIFSAGGKQYSLDESGLVFEEYQNGEGLPLISAPFAAAPQIGARAVEKETMRGILRVIGEMRGATDIAPAEAIIASPERVNLLTQEGWYVYFHPRRDISDQIVKLLAVINDESFKQKRKNLEYVDVRFTRVYLKEKDNNAAPPPSLDPE